MEAESVVGQARNSEGAASFILSQSYLSQSYLSLDFLWQLKSAQVTVQAEEEIHEQGGSLQEQSLHPGSAAPLSCFTALLLWMPDGE